MRASSAQHNVKNISIALDKDQVKEKEIRTINESNSKQIDV